MSGWDSRRGRTSALKLFAAATLACVTAVVSVAPTTGATTATPRGTDLARVGEGSTCPRDLLGDLRFTSLAYKAVLGHFGSDRDAMFLASRLQYPTSQTYVEVAATLTDSLEARRGIVTGLYQLLLHRAPDPGGLDWWAQWLSGGVSPTELAASLANSNEYRTRSGGTDQGWVTTIYGDLLGREPDDAGAAGWLAQLASGRSRAAVTRDIYLARERRVNATAALYERVLGRTADSGGLAYWADQMFGHGETWVLTMLVASSDFWRHAQVVYGGSPTPQPPVCPKPDPHWPASPRLVYTLADHPNPSPHLIALTFDDGPNPTYTPQILDVLKSRGVKATFFTVGSWAQRYPDLIRRELAEGHHVANHTWDHLSLTSLSVANVGNVIQSTTDVVNGIAGRNVVSCVRPPYGNRNTTTDAVAFGQGLSVIIWSRDSGDWQRPGVGRIIAQSMDERYDGGRGILGMHDGGGDRSQTVAALGPLIDNLRAQGYQFATIC